jgi:transketolase
MDNAAIDTKGCEAYAVEMRRKILAMIHAAGSGHCGGSLSVCEILIALYCFEMNIDPKRPRDAKRDRCILSKGHAAPALYAVLSERGFFPADELLDLRKFGSRMQGHPDMKKTPGVDVSSGSLGMGLSYGLGVALAGALDGLEYTTYVVTGCGELNEGQNWEAFMAAAKYKASRLILLVDYNKVQLDGSNDEVMPMESLADKLRAFNWNVLECDGHDVGAIVASIRKAKGRNEGPSAIICHTIKGKGISFMENTNEWHGKALDDEKYREALAELNGRAR